MRNSTLISLAYTYIVSQPRNPHYINYYLFCSCGCSFNVFNIELLVCEFGIWFIFPSSKSPWTRFFVCNQCHFSIAISVSMNWFCTPLPLLTFILLRIFCITFFTLSPPIWQIKFSSRLRDTNNKLFFFRRPSNFISSNIFFGKNYFQYSYWYSERCIEKFSFTCI